MQTHRVPQGRRLPQGLRLVELLTVTDETDETGRLLLEDAAPPEAVRKVLRKGVAMEHTRCPYEDSRSRRGKPMNVSAYEAVRRDTREVLDGFAWLAEHYDAAQLGERGTAQGLADVTKLGGFVPLVLFHRADDHVRRHGQLPSFVASIFKASRGMFSTAFDMCTRAGGPADRPSATDVLAFAEREGHLARADTGRVCAAPTKLIERTLSAMLSQQGADAQASRLGELVAFDTLAAFFDVERSLSAGLSRYGAVLERLTQHDLGPHNLAPHNLAPHNLVKEPEALFGVRVQVGDDVRTFGELTELCLAFANEAQRALNDLLGRAANAPPLVFHDILHTL